MMQVIWLALHDRTPVSNNIDSSLTVRSAAAASLNECLKVMSHRNPSEAQHGAVYNEMWESIKKGAQARENEVIHGSLLALGMFCFCFDSYFFFFLFLSFSLPFVVLMSILILILRRDVERHADLLHGGPLQGRDDDCRQRTHKDEDE
jgi:hypothetical protein